MFLCCREWVALVMVAGEDHRAVENKNVSITLRNDFKCTQAIAGEQSVASNNVKKTREAQREIN